MSEKDRFDWNDDVEFGDESMAMEDGDVFESSLEGFDDFDDTSDYGSEDTGVIDSPADDAWEGMDRAEAESSAEPAEESPTTDELEARKKRGSGPGKITVQRRSGISALGMGFLFAASILVAGIGVGGAVLFAEGVNPASLWQPKELMQIDQWLNFSEHPLNVIYLVSLGITFLALLGSYRMGKVAVESNARTRAAEEMLDSVCALRFDEQEAWRDEGFKAFPPAEEFVIKTLGAWRLQEARQKRLMGIEGEIHRLENALSGDSRTDLTGHYENPAIGRLVDEMLRHIDARDAAVKKAAEAEKRDQDAGNDILGSVQEAGSWNWEARGRVEDGSLEASRVAEALNTLAGEIREQVVKTDDRDGMMDVLTGVRKELESLAKAAPDSGPADESRDELNDLVDRGSKLAFQIAMEVTRLGPRGERLLPMSQALEDLTTGFRKTVDDLPAAVSGSGSAVDVAPVTAKLDALQEMLSAERETDGLDLSGSLDKAAPVAAKLADELNGLAADFSIQGDRLNTIGQAVADLSDQTFEVEEAPESRKATAKVEPLVLERQTPRKTEPEVGTEPASFVDHSRGFTLDAEPEVETPLHGDEEPVYDLDAFGASSLELDSPEPAPETAADDPVEEEVFELETFGAAPVEAPEEEADEPVYDLDQFAAEPLETAAPGAGAEETVYDLDNFGAEPVTPTVDATADDEPVYEISDLGGDLAQDEVLDLETFGAVPVDASTDADEADEDVFDLNEFGARSLD